MSLLLEALGTTATILYATACVPLAWEAWRDGETPTPRAASWTFFMANVLFGTYCVASFGIRVPFVMVGVEVLCWGTVLRYTYFPSRHAKP